MEQLQVHVRQAALDDTEAISRLFRARIPTWQRFNEGGQVVDVPYQDLTIYERWLHGGPWMSVETGALQLSHLLCGAGLPLVALRDDKVVAYAEAYRSIEAPPFGHHLNLAHMMIDQRYLQSGVDDAMIVNLIEAARALKCERFAVSCVVNDTESIAFYQEHGLGPLARSQRLSLSAKTGQIFYRAVEHNDASASQIREWYMPVGRETSARHQWETLWPHMWDSLPEIRRQRTHRLHFSTAGQEAFICVQQQMYDARTANVYCWSPKPLTGSLLTSVRDWAHREGYRTLVMIVMEDTVKLFGADADSDGFYQEIYAIEV